MSKTLTRTSPAPFIQCIVLIGSDTNLLDRDGNSVTTQTFMAAVDVNILTVRQWYWDNCRGYTFNVLPSLLYRHASTEAALAATWANNMVGLFGNVIEVLHAANTINADCPQACFTVATPLPILQTGGSIVGIAVNAEQIGIPGGVLAHVNHKLPGAMWVGSDRMGRLLGGLLPSLPDAGQPAEACGLMAHELGHGLGGFEYPVYSMAPHPLPDPGNRLMGFGLYAFPGCVFTAAEVDRVLRSPFMTAQIRPS